MTQNLKLKRQNVIFLLVFLKIALVFAQGDSLKKIVIIDPGHGGIDSGAIGFGIQEKNITLAIAKEVLKLNRDLWNDHLELYLTRYSDTLVSLPDRSRLAKTLHANAFTSIHCNASSSAAKGIEVFTSNKSGGYDESSCHLASHILKTYHERLGFHSRGVKRANLAVLRQASDAFPAVLIEVGFITRKEEATYFSNPKHITAIALALLEGLYNYLNPKL
ncbi:N-acetylmuramoyl-L-alanine amidase family protein [Aestuariibaculum sediminum]|uniref:N-acetylmuramoyl-L-alanine amidase n=1 Tax=Aestuariibaculum sediminum TaxID=2770637 RepID=A0A8J6QA37_9FLAO|nr:N-acetylmuramoyl-L-alanine amidase [Aestuariibaculum sediminum]MBD0831516.1 N-acetylmuramoyl-L-alanine amidase [Aestuariibaculum sediminum]